MNHVNNEMRYHDFEESHEIVQVICGFFVLGLQAGLAFTEAGRSRWYNAASILLRQMICSLLAIQIFWVLGYAFTFGGMHTFIGWDNHVALSGTNKSSYGHFFIHSIVSAIPSSVMGGAIAERSHITGHLVLSLAMGGLLYPIVAHWTWDSKGWLLAHGFIDVGGCLPVHVVSGSLALTACLITGNRVEKLGSRFSTVISGHSLPLSGVGWTLIFMGMVSKAVGLGVPRISVGQVAMNCLVSACGSGCISVLLHKLLVKSTHDVSDWPPAGLNRTPITCRRWSYYYCVNGAFAGLVAVQAGAGQFFPWGSYVVGLVAGILYFAVSRLNIRLKLDDTTDAIAVHLLPAFWGLIAVPLFTDRDMFDETNSRGIVIGYQIAGGLAAFFWTMATTSIILAGLLYSSKLKLDVHVEYLGSDIIKIEEEGYHWQADGDSFLTDHAKTFYRFSASESPPHDNQTNLFSSRTLTGLGDLHECSPMTSTKKIDDDILTNFYSRPRSNTTGEAEKSLVLSTKLPTTSPIQPIPINIIPPSEAKSPQDPIEVSIHSPGERIVFQEQSQALRNLIREQKGKLKASIGYMKCPSPSLVNRRRSLDDSNGSTDKKSPAPLGDIAINPSNFNYLNIARNMKMVRKHLESPETHELMIRCEDDERSCISGDAGSNDDPSCFGSVQDLDKSNPNSSDEDGHTCLELSVNKMENATVDAKSLSGSKESSII